MARRNDRNLDLREFRIGIGAALRTEFAYVLSLPLLEEMVELLRQLDQASDRRHNGLDNRHAT